MGIIYVMVTNWDRHWDQIEKTYFTKKVVRFPLNEICGDTKTLFVKINKTTRNIEHVYVGRIEDVKEGDEKIYFRVVLEKRISSVPRGFPPDKLKKPGWYRHYALSVEQLDEESDLFPPFFDKLKTTADWIEFEDKVYLLLKLIGITTIHKYFHEKQAGLPDGIFKIGNLVVIYDATLGSIDTKSNQIINYINLLKTDKLKVSSKETWDIKNYSRQVWIITRNQNTRLDRVEENVRLKMISVDSLVNFYSKRLREIDREEDLAEALEKIET